GNWPACERGHDQRSKSNCAGEFGWKRGGCWRYLAALQRHHPIRWFVHAHKHRYRQWLRQYPTGNLSNGATYNSTAQIIDQAGNPSSASGIFKVTESVPLPAAPTGLDLAAADDSGFSSTDNITKNTSGLTISGTGAKGLTVTLYDDANNNGVQDAGEATL